MKDMRKQKYYWHKSHAKQRGVEFKLTFDEWWDIWQESGRWEQRGNKKGQYNMCRFGDIGAYEKGNIRIDTHGNNISEAHSGKKKSTIQKNKISSSLKGSTPWNKGKKTGHIPWNKGKKMSNQFKRKISQSHKDKILTEEHKRKISEGLKNNND